uniref:Putative conserved secreted protein n=1 Tax=Nyssomyia neivai TaxID=330878 RepID=A0A1L8DP02_9DIPT
MAAIKLLFLALLIGAASALECYSCNSGDIGQDCVWNNQTSKWSTLKCPSDQTVCAITLVRASENDTMGFSDRGCQKDINFCKEWLDIGEHPTKVGLHLSCYVCNTGKCNGINALDISSSTRSLLNIFLLLLPLFIIMRKVTF